MPADQIRNRTVGCKMTDGECERLSAVVESEGMTLGEWCREVLLERADGRKPSVIEETLLASLPPPPTSPIAVDDFVAVEASRTLKFQQL
jgi:hypothetical protein